MHPTLTQPATGIRVLACGLDLGWHKYIFSGLQLHRPKYLHPADSHYLLIMLIPSPSLLVLMALAALSFGASLVQVEDFGVNPTNIDMYIYVPDKLATKPAIIVAVS
jgi:hypothetical protein